MHTFPEQITEHTIKMKVTQKLCYSQKKITPLYIKVWLHLDKKSSSTKSKLCNPHINQ